jgi:hypothetical protein
MAKTPKHLPPADPRKEIVRTIQQLAHRHSTWQVFADFVAACAITVSNAVDWPQREPREAEYMRLIKRYTPDELAHFPRMFAHLTDALEIETSDVLGSVYHELELHNKWAGQYFSPYPICRMMAAMTVGQEEVKAKIAERGYITASEPACGSGAMVIAIADELRSAKINYQQSLHVTAVDVDIKCVHMAYTQLALLGVPAVVVQGNSLTLEEHSHWYTPMHILGGWQWKLKRDRIAAAPPLAEIAHEVRAEEPVAIAAASEAPATPRRGKRTDQLTLF